MESILGAYNNLKTTQDFAGALPTVENPDQAFADITRQDYNDYIGNFRDSEKKLLSMTDDTTLIDRARQTAPQQAKIAAGIQARNRERYGGGLSNAQLEQQQRTAQRGGQLSFANTLNNARVQQRSTNQALLQELIGIGQGVNARALEGLGTAAQGEVQRRGAYKNSKANYASQMTNMGASVLAAFLI